MTDADRRRAWNSSLPARSGYMNPGKGLSRRQGLQDTPRLALVAPVIPIGTPRQRTPIKPVSAKRARENRERAAIADRLWPDRREGTVMCGCGRPECHRRADDLHETLTRARSGGDITNPDIWVPLARECHAEIQLGPDWAYAAGLIKHSGLCCQGRKVCARYSDPGDAA